MIIETDRLIIRDVALPDGEAFIHMASDGSLNDVGFVVISKCCAMAQCKIWRRSYGFYWNQ